MVSWLIDIQSSFLWPRQFQQPELLLLLLLLLRILLRHLITNSTRLTSMMHLRLHRLLPPSSALIANLVETTRWVRILFLYLLDTAFHSYPKPLHFVFFIRNISRIVLMHAILFVGFASSFTFNSRQGLFSIVKHTKEFLSDILWVYKLFGFKYQKRIVFIGSILKSFFQALCGFTSYSTLNSRRRLF